MKTAAKTSNALNAGATVYYRAADGFVKATVQSYDGHRYQIKTATGETANAFPWDMEVPRPVTEGYEWANNLPDIKCEAVTRRVMSIEAIEHEIEALRKQAEAKRRELDAYIASEYTEREIEVAKAGINQNIH